MPATLGWNQDITLTWQEKAALSSARVQIGENPYRNRASRTRGESRAVILDCITGIYSPRWQHSKLGDINDMAFEARGMPAKLATHETRNSSGRPHIEKYSLLVDLAGDDAQSVIRRSPSMRRASIFQNSSALPDGVTHMDTASLKRPFCVSGSSADCLTARGENAGEARRSMRSLRNPQPWCLVAHSGRPKSAPTDGET